MSGPSLLAKEEAGSQSPGPLGFANSDDTRLSASTTPPSPPQLCGHQQQQSRPLKLEEHSSLLSTLHMDIKMELKLEPKPEPSPSQSPTLNGSEQDASRKFKLSPTPTPPPTTAIGTPSASSTPPPSVNNAKKPQAPVPQLIGDLPVARSEALSTFNEIPENSYQYKTLGRSREALESMSCDCFYESGISDPDDACGHNCINRLTQVECLPGDCRCKAHCRNQRFQRKEYANIEIVLTEKKGYGLRVEEDLPKDTFIYEYVGDIVSPVSFKKRMREYAEEGIQHFYFMMLQKDEFIDATKNGGIGRFANHSCRPNCYVARWTIGEHVRMGIFAKRNIKKHEELTFNYNVDRYGHQAQICYCGESNCVGYIGGKTQTDIASMDDLYLDALGITDEADLVELKGNKRKRGKKIDDPDFMPTLKPISESDVPKVVQAIRQTQSRKVLSKLLGRIKITEDQAALRQIMRLRGYSLMTNVLEDYASDLELITLVLECMSTWPLLNRNKVEDSKVFVPVQKCMSSLENAVVKELAQKLLDHWDTLPVYNRIPKRIKQDGEDEEEAATVTIAWDDPVPNDSYGDYDYDREPSFNFKAAPTWRPRPVRPRPEALPPPPPKAEPRNANHFSRESIQAVISAAAEAKAAQEKAVAEAAAAEAAVQSEKQASHTARKKQKLAKKTLSADEKEALKEKRLLKLVGAVVVKCMSKHSKTMDHDQFKKYAKELTQIIADKEKRSSSYKEGKLEVLSDEKVAKIKKFAKEYIAKVLRKIEKSGKRLNPPSSSSATPGALSTNAADTPDSIEAMDTVMADMLVEDVMDMEPNSDEEDGDPEEPGGEPSESKIQTAENATLASPSQQPGVTVDEVTDEKPMDLDDPPSSTHTPDLSHSAVLGRQANGVSSS